ncbi:unnamed protein product [Hydatigera taeniaeformis]|uniref:DUF2428 domain-containing protein n=1 Tax=Hydatigena taeniaeformis TaxID=6205 RepID=A0A0R3WIA7_HYDTA|nr:unnamed protein product [Hydatigera taeniaeformis]
MSANSIGAQLRRFVAICQSEADPNTRLSHPLNRSPAEWSHLSDLLCSLLKSCPPSRSAILSFIHPIVVAHLQAISTHQQSQIVEGVSPQKRRWQPPLVLPSEAFITAVLAEAMEVCKRESIVLRDQYQSSFAADVCAFALDILTPIAPPPHRDVSLAWRYRRNRAVIRQHVHTNLRYGRQKNNNNNTSSSSTNNCNNSKRPHSDVESTAEDISELDEINDSGSESNSSENDSDGVINEAASGDDVEVECAGAASVESVETEDLSPDLRPIGFNLRLLGPLWMSSAVVKQLLRIIFACLVGRLSSCACVERLVAAALPHEFRGRWRRGTAPPLHPLNHKMDFAACQPHWCTNWLLRQITDAGLSSVVDSLCRRLLEVCLRGPLLGQLPYSAEYHRFWALAGLSNLVFCCVFFAPLVRLSLTGWLEKKLTELRNAQPPPLIHVLAPLIILAPRGSPTFSDVVPAHSAIARLRHLNSQPPSSNMPRWGSSPHPPPPPPPPPPSQTFNGAPSALVVASGFLPHEFHLLSPHSEQVRCLVAACTEIRSTVLSTLRAFVEKVTKEADAHTLETSVEGLFRAVSDQEVELFKELLVDSICLASKECGCECLELLLRLESSTSMPSAIVSSTQSLLRLLSLRAHEAAVCRCLSDSEVPRFFLGRTLLEHNNGSDFLFYTNIGCSGAGTGGVLMQHLIKGGSYYAGLMLTLYACYTRNSHLARILFRNVILWNLGAGPHNLNKARCPLLFFLPLLSEWASVNLGPTSAPQELLCHCLQDVLDTIAIATWEEQQKALVNLLWLVQREQRESSDIGPQIDPAILALLPRFVAFLPGLVEETSLKNLELALHLLEVVEKSPPIQLSVVDSICIGRRLACLLVSLMERLDRANMELQDLAIRAFRRVDDLLEKLADSNELVRDSALVSIAQAACDQFSTTKSSPLFEMAPTSILLNTDRPSDLLLDNPPPPPESAFRTTAIKGQLIRRNPLNPKVPQGNEFSVWKPSTCLWIYLVRRLISSSNSPLGINVAHQHYFGRALEDALLPHGLQLPQTNVQTCTLNPPAFQQPCGLGLERILALLRAFLPDWKLSSPSINERVLWGFVELLLQPPPTSSDAAASFRNCGCLLLSTFCIHLVENIMDDTTKRLPLPAMRLLLGLLSGLEVTWASLLSPRVPLSTFTDNAEVEAVLGVFPLPGIPTVARQRARKLAVEHGHRRVDTSSRLYNATELLLTRLAQFPITSKPINHPNSSSSSPLPPPPLEGLLCLLTPREMAFCLSETRRGVRLRAYLAWRGGGGIGSSSDGVFALSAGMLRALAQSHLVEDGLASLVPRLLLHFTPSASSPSSSSFPCGNSASGRRLLSILNRKGGEVGYEEDEEEGSAEIEEDEEDEGGRIREIDVDGEVMVVLDD